jgi:hypothetical protein
MTKSGLAPAIEFENAQFFATGSFADELVRLHELRKQVFPTGVRSIVETQGRPDRIADPLGLRKLDRIGAGVLGAMGGVALSRFALGTDLIRAATLHTDLAASAGICTRSRPPRPNLDPRSA